MNDLKSRIKQAVFDFQSSRYFTASELHFDGPLEQCNLEDIEAALRSLADDGFLGESKLERRRGHISYFVRGGSRHPWRKKHARARR
jgi:hypothetical protein